MAGVLAGMLALIASPGVKAQTAGFYERKAEGWFWYAKEPEPIPEPEEPIEEPAPQVPEVVIAAPQQEPQEPQGPAVLSSAWIKEHMPKYLMEAIDNPTVENVKAYLYLQRIAMDRADQYTKASEMATLGDPFLDETVRRPLAGFAVRTVDAASGLARNSLVTSLAKKAGLFVFFSSGCSLCELQAPLLKSLSEHEGFSIVPISLDGKNLSQNPFPSFRTDNGHAEQLQVQTLPAIYLATPDGQFAAVGQGAFSLPELQHRIIVAARREGWISDAEFNKTRPILNNNNLADLLTTANPSNLAALEAVAGPDGMVAPEVLLNHIQQVTQGQ